MAIFSRFSISPRVKGLTGAASRVATALALILGALTGPSHAQVSTPIPAPTEPAARVKLIAPTLAPPTPTPFPQKGVLSRAATKNYNTKIVDGPWAGGGDSQGAAPIAGSVSRKSGREWVAKLYNNSEDAYSVSVEVIQMNKSGKKEKTDSFSTRLSAKGSYERSLRATERTVDCQLNLVSWKNLTAKKAITGENEGSANEAISPETER
jgi:hypothetical protein